MKKSPKFSNDQVFQFFLFFLNRNKAYDSFVENLTDSRLFSFFDSFADTNPKYYIVLAFSWQSTPEGAKYWDDLNDKWRLSLKFFNF